MHRLLFLLLLFNLGCVSSKNLPEPETITSADASGQDILFVLYEISKTDNTPNAEMISGMLKPGQLKEEMRSTAKSSEDDILVLESIDKNQEIIKTLYFSNPLYERVEYAKDDEGNLAVQELNHSKKELIARMNVDDSIQNLKLYYRKSAKSKRKLIHSINIQ